MGFALDVPGPADLKDLPFAGRVERLGECVVRAGVGVTHGLGDAGLGKRRW